MLRGCVERREEGALAEVLRGCVFEIVLEMVIRGCLLVGFC